MCANCKFKGLGINHKGESGQQLQKENAIQAKVIEDTREIAGRNPYCPHSEISTVAEDIVEYIDGPLSETRR